MSAEQQKVLWIIASVAFLIVALLGVGLWWFYPRAAEQTASVMAAAPEPAVRTAPDFDPIEWVRSKDAHPGLEAVRDSSVRTGDVIIIYPDRMPDSSVGSTSAPQAGRESAARSEAAPSGDGADPAAGTGSATETPGGASAGTAEQSAQPAEKKPAAPAAATPPASRPSPQETAKSPAPAAKAPTAVAKAPSAAATQAVNEYWIQVASFTSVNRAEDAKVRLQQQGVSSVITTRAIEGDTYFRVRVGPYANRNEAAKFLDWVRKVEGFERSYVSLVPVVASSRR